MSPNILRKAQSCPLCMAFEAFWGYNIHIMNIYKRLLFIINPNAGVRRKEVPLVDIIMCFSDHGYETVVCFTKEHGDGTRLVEEHAGDSIDLIVCMGGDGTLNEVISGCQKIDWDKPMGYIPAGSTNDFAASLGLPGDPLEAAERIMTGTPQKLDIGEFNGRSFVYTASCGIFSRTSYETPQSVKNLLGHFAYILEGMKGITQFRPYEMKITADDETFEGNFIFATICNTFSLGGVMTLDRDFVDLGDGLFELLLITVPKDLVQLNLIVRALLEQNYDTPYVKVRKIRSAEMIFSDITDWSLDGEYEQGREHCRFEVHPAAVQMIY